MAASPPPPPPLNSFILIFSPALPYHNLDYENNPCLKGKGDLEKTCLFLRHALVERSSTNVKKNNKSPPLFLGKTMEKGEGCRSNSKSWMVEREGFISENRFFKKYPTFETAKDNINLEIIHSILGNHIENFNVTASEFEILRNITPKRFELPITDKGAFTETVGKYSRNSKSGRPGVYIFTNKKKRILLRWIFSVS
nr:hypothetical protein [Morchella crassipes]